MDVLLPYKISLKKKNFNSIEMEAKNELNNFDFDVKSHIYQM